MTNNESQAVEYKQSWRNDCLKAISAVANSDGGMLIVGLDDQGEPFGLKNIKKVLEDTPNTIRNKLGLIPFVEENGVMTVTFYKDKWNTENLRKLGLNERQIKAVTYVTQNDKISNQEYQVICEISNRTATRDLTELISLKIF